MDALLTELLDGRVSALNDRPAQEAKPFVLLWLQGQRRVRDNLALSHAARRANELQRPLVLYEGLRKDYPHASDRHHRFILEGARDNAREAARLGFAYAFFLERPGTPRGVLHALAARAALVVTDTLPAFIHPAQTAALARRAPCRVEGVDAAGIAPLSAFPRAEIGARTLRPKILRLLDAGVRAAPLARPRVAAPKRFDWGFEPLLLDGDLDAAVASCPIDHAVPPVRSRPGGTRAALQALERFLRDGLHGYDEERNQPDAERQSGLSPYLHFGHLGAGEVARAVRGSEAKAADREAFLEELIVRRELGLNFSAHTADTTSLDALPPWARRTLAEHSRDPRPALLDDDALDQARSPDPLWNAAQRQLREEGRIHGYLRMLWGKLLLLWSRDAGEALRRMRWLNDRWALDGRDAVSETNFLWCLGLHDRPFPERAIFGTVRSMTSASALRKLSLDRYLARFGAQENLISPPVRGLGF